MTDFLKAEAGVRQLHARYGDAVWRKDAAAFGNCFAEDGEWRIAGMVLCGRANIADSFAKIMTQLNRVLITFRTPILDVGDGVATARTYTTEDSSYADGRRALTISTYYDRVIDEGDHWRFSWRLFVSHYSGPHDLSGTYYDSKDYGPPPAMPGLDEMSPDHTGLGAKTKAMG